MCKEYLKIFPILFILIWTNVIWGLKNMDDFQYKFFKFDMPDRGTYEIDVGMGDYDHNEGGDIPLAIVDLNNDKKNDLITTNINKTIIRFYLFEEDEFVSTKHPLIVEQPITNLIVGDWTQHDNPDLLIVFEEKMRIYAQKSDLSYEPTVLEFEIEAGSQPFVLDINGDFRLDLIYNMPTSSEQVRKVLIQDKDQPMYKTHDFSTYMDNSNECLSLSNIRPLANPHSSAFLDLNGDCTSDIFIISEENGKTYFEIWIKNKKEDDPKYCLVYNEKAGNYMSQVSFADIDRDGGVDIIYSELKEGLEVLKVLYNKNPKQELCPSVSLKHSKDLFPSPHSGDSKYSSSFIITPTGTAIVPDPIGNVKTLRIGDFDSDGYPDIIAVLGLMDNQKSPEEEKGDAYILSNIPCNSDICPANNRRAFGQLTLMEMGNRGSHLMAAFFDLGENGPLDLMIIAENNEKMPTINFLYNFNQQDVFFLKTMGVSSSNTGCIEYGMNVQFLSTDLDGNRHIQGGPSIHQSGYSPLQLPYGIYGIGRSNNYIEHLTIGYPLHGVDNIKEWSPIIPNSQIILHGNHKSADGWTLELFISPSKKLYLIIMIDIVLLMILIAIISMLHYREKKQDQEVFYSGAHALARI